jgi:hypothetical protein
LDVGRKVPDEEVPHSSAQRTGHLCGAVGLARELQGQPGAGAADRLELVKGVLE